MSKFFSRRPGGDIFIITKSPPELYSHSKIKIGKPGGEIKPLNEYDNATIIFDDILGTSNGKYIDQFFIRGRHDNLDMFYLSQSYFDLSKRTIRHNSNKVILFNQTLKNMANKNGDIEGYDMSYDEFKHICRKSWEED